jgi:hypothetical protein
LYRSALRYDPRDMAEIRVFIKIDLFAVQFVRRSRARLFRSGKSCARNRRRRELRTILRGRKKIVDELTAVKRASVVRADPAEVIKPDETERREPALKRYINE